MELIMRGPKVNVTHSNALLAQAKEQRHIAMDILRDHLGKDHLRRSTWRKVGRHLRKGGKLYLESAQSAQYMREAVERQTEAAKLYLLARKPGKVRKINSKQLAGYIQLFNFAKENDDFEKMAEYHAAQIVLWEGIRLQSLLRRTLRGAKDEILSTPDVILLDGFRINRRS